MPRVENNGSQLTVIENPFTTVVAAPLAVTLNATKCSELPEDAVADMLPDSIVVPDDPS